MHTFTRTTLALTLAAPAFGHDDPIELVVEGDVVAGVGVVTSISNLVVNDAGGWIVEADTDNVNTDADSVLIQTGILLMREGDVLAAPAGASVGSFDSLSLNEASQSAWNLFLDGTAGGNDSGVFLGSTLLFQEGDAITAPGITPGSPWLGFFDVKLNNSDQILVTGSMEDTAIVASTVDRVLAVIDVSAGVLGAMTVVAKEADILAGQVTGLTDIGTNPQETAFNDSGDVLFAVDIPGMDAIYLNATGVAQEGAPSPIAGRNWQSLTSTSLGLNDHGDYAFRGDLDGDTTDDKVIIKNGAVFAREGETRPEIMPFGITGFGSGPVQIANNDSVLWYAEWDDPNGDVNSGLFVDDELVVQEGVTEVGGLVFDTVRGITDGYAFSPSGEFLIFEGVLENGDEGAFLVQLDTLDAHAYCTPVVNSTGSPAQITAQGSSSLIENNLVLLAQPMGAGQPGVFYYGPSEIQTPFGNGFRCVGGAVVRLWPPVVASGTGVLLRAVDFLNLPSGAAINAGQTWKFQAWFRDPLGGGAGFNLSDGLSIAFSP